MEVQCDNPSCNYSEDAVGDTDDLQPYVDKPCPKCGTNLLTKEDYKRWLVMSKFNNFMKDEEQTAENIIGFFDLFEEDELQYLGELLDGIDKSILSMSEEEREAAENGTPFRITVHGHNGYTISSPKIGKGGEE